MMKRDQDNEETSIFEAFLLANPQFAGERICSWKLAAPNDPPDVICATESGKTVGVDIAQWAHQSEMAAGKAREAVEQNIRDAIGSQPPNTSENFELVVFFPRQNVRLPAADHASFRRALFQLIEHVDRNWPAKLSTRFYRFPDLAKFPPLGKYLMQVRFVSGTSSDSPFEWIVPAGSMDSFDGDTMLAPLLDILEKKAEKCRRLKTPCDSLHLVIAYDQAVGRCSPLTMPMDTMTKEMALALDARPSPFRTVFVLKGDQAYQVPFDVTP
jgi:hypothetical protein